MLDINIGWHHKLLTILHQDLLKSFLVLGDSIDRHAVPPLGERLTLSCALNLLTMLLYMSAVVR